MLNEMIKEANLSLADKVKVAAAVIAMHQYDRTQDIIESAREMKKTAALRGIDLPDELAIQAAAQGYAELDSEKNAGMSLDRLLTRLGRVPGQLADKPWILPAAGAGVGAGAGALIDDEDRLRGALIGGGAGALGGLAGSSALKARKASELGGKFRGAYQKTPGAQKRSLARELAKDKASRAGHGSSDMSAFYKVQESMSPELAAKIFDPKTGEIINKGALTRFLQSNNAPNATVKATRDFLNSLNG